TLVSALLVLALRRKYSVHRANRREVDAPAEQRRVDLDDRLVSELGAMERVEDRGALRVAHAAWTGGPLREEAARRRRPRAAIQGRAAHAQRLARRRDRHDRIREIFHEVHQVSSSRTGRAMPRISCAFFWSAMTASAMCSLRSRTAVRLSSWALRRSFASSLGFRPIFRGSSPAAPCLPSCPRHDERAEL